MPWRRIDCFKKCQRQETRTRVSVGPTVTRNKTPVCDLDVERVEGCRKQMQDGINMQCTEGECTTVQTQQKTALGCREMRIRNTQSAVPNPNRQAHNDRTSQVLHSSNEPFNKAMSQIPVKIVHCLLIEKPSRVESEPGASQHEMSAAERSHGVRSEPRENIECFETEEQMAASQSRQEQTNQGERDRSSKRHWRK